MKKYLFPIISCLFFLFAHPVLGQKVKPEKIFKKYQIISIPTTDIFVKVKEKKGGVFKVKVHNWNMDLYKSDFISRKYRSYDENYRLVHEDQPLVIPMKGKTNKGEDAALTLGEEFVYGYVVEKGKKFYIEPAEYFDTEEINTGPDSYIIYDVEDIIQGEIQYCGYDEELIIGENLHSEIKNRTAGLCFEIDYAICNDYSMVQKYGSAIGAELHAIGVLNSILSNFDDEFPDEFRFVLNGQFTITSAGGDPWTSSTDPTSLLISFRDWAPGGLVINHDIATLWTSRDLNDNVVGVAFTYGLCNYYGKYNVVQDFSADPELKRVLLAHEIGHNLGSGHDAAGSDYIMAPSVNYTSQWSPVSISDITDFVRTRTCNSICPGTIPLVYFENELRIEFESSVSGPLSECADYYKDVSEVVSISHYPQENIVVDIVVDESSTAEEGRDFILLTSQIQFGTSGTLDKSFIIRIIDDKWEESEELIRLNLVIKEGNATVGDIGQLEIILDSPMDMATEDCCSTVESYEIGQQVNYTNIMFWGHSEDIRSRVLIPASELISSGLQEGNIHQLGIFVLYKNSVGIFNNYRVGMRNVTETNLSNSPWYSTTQVYMGDYSTREGQWNYFNFDSPFYWDGTSSLYFQFCFDNDFESASDFVLTMPYPSAGGNEMLGTRVNYGTDGCSLTNTSTYYYYTDRLANIRLNQFGKINYENNPSSSSEGSIKTGEKAHYYSENGGLIATITNTGGQDLDCVSVSIIDNGNGKNNLPESAYYYSDKIININTDYNASYELSIYMHDDQLSTWSGEKGNLNFLQSSVLPAQSNGNNRDFIGQTGYMPPIFPGEIHRYTTQVIGSGYFSLTNGFQRTVNGTFAEADFYLRQKHKGIVLQNGINNYYQIRIDTFGFLKSVQGVDIEYQSEITGDLMLDDHLNGLILTDENGENWKITVDENGTLEIAAVSAIPANNIELTTGNFCIQNPHKGLILKNSEGECWRLYMDDFGNIGTLQVRCSNE